MGQESAVLVASRSPSGPRRRDIYQAIVTEIDQRAAFPGSGEMVDVGEHRLHLNFVGRGSPPVVLDGGWAYTSVEWSGWVQPEVAEHTRVCSYDRAGMGWSEPEPGPPDFTQTADELHTLLQEADEDGPYVLVGLYSRLYAERYPGEVAGMVLVDSTHPDQFEGSGLASTMNRAAGVLGPLLARTQSAPLLSAHPGPWRHSSVGEAYCRGGELSKAGTAPASDPRYGARLEEV